MRAAGRPRRRRGIGLLAAIVVGLIPAVVTVAAPEHVGATDPYSTAVLANSPAIYYRLDDSSGTTAVDSSGNGHDGTYDGSVTLSVAGALVGSANTAVQGAGSWSITQGGSSLPTGSAARTYEVWLKTTYGADHTLIGTGDHAGNHQFDIQIHDDTGLRLVGDGGATTGLTLPWPYDDGVWHLIDVSFSSGSAAIFLDGQEVGQLSVTLATTTGDGLQIDNGNGFAGKLDEFAAYSAALSPGDIGSHWAAGQSGSATGCASAPASPYPTAVLADSPSAYYRLNDTGAGHGREVLDSSSTTTCHPAALLNGATSDTSALAGDSDAATQGSSGLPSVLQSGASLPSSTSARTMEFWERTNTDWGHMLFSQGDPSNHGFSMVLRSDVGLDVTGDGATTVSTTLIRPYDDAAWHMFDVAYSSGTVALYEDGARISTFSLSVNTVQGDGLRLDNGYGGVNFDALDEFAVYPAALTDSQVAKHWTRGGSAAAGSCASAPSGPYATSVLGDSPLTYFPLGDLGVDSNTRVALDEASTTTCQNGSYAPGSTATPDGPSIGEAVGGTEDTSSATVLASGGSLPTGSSSRTLEIWARTKVDWGHALIQTGDQAGGHQFNLSVRSDTAVRVTGDGGAYVEFSLPGGHDYDDGRWHQFDVTYDGTYTEVYYDGLSLGSSALTVNSSAGFGVLMGTISGNEAIADFSSYSGVLSSGAIAGHFGAAGPVGGPNEGPSTYGGDNNRAKCACEGFFMPHQSKVQPIDTEYGNLWHDFTDISIPGRSYPLMVTRSYNSQADATNGPFGYGWSTNYGMSLSLSGSGPHQVATIAQENGAEASYDEPPSGTVWAPTAPRFTATLTHNISGTWTFVRNGRDTFEFNSSGVLQSETDLNGYVTTFTYTLGKLTGVTDPAGRSLTIGWTGSNITSVVDANVSPSRTVSYSYDGYGNLTDVVDVNGGHWQYLYNDGDVHHVTSILDPNCYAAGGSCNGGYGVQTQYSGALAVWQKDQLGRQTTFDWSNYPLVLITDPVGNVEGDYYVDGMLMAKTLGYGTSDAATWRFAYDPETLVRTVTIDPNGGQTTVTVDASGNILTVTDPLGRVTTKTYNGLNEVLTSEDGIGVTTTNTYDGNGNLTQTSTPLVGTADHQVTDFHHANMTYPGDVTSIDDPNGKTTYFHHDANGYLDQVKDPLGHVTGTVHNAIGWVTASYTPKAACTWNSSPPTGCSSTYETVYDYTIPGTMDTNEFGQVQTVTDPLSHATVFGYDANGNRISVQDGSGNTTTTAFDLANERTTVTRPDSTTQVTDYNDDGTLLDQKDGAGHAIQTYGYDHVARVSSVTDALSNTTTYFHDRAGNLTAKQDPSGNCSAGPPTGCTQMTYDADNQLKTITYSDGVTPNVTNVAYDDDGQRTGMTDGTGTSAWVWDSLHRLTSYTNGNGKTVAYGFGSDLKNQVSTIAYPNSAGTVTQTWNDDGTMASVQDWNSKTTTFGYDNNANLHTITMPSTLNVVDTFGFNAADQMTSISDSNGSTLFSASYGRDTNGQLSSDSSVAGTVGSFKYTGLNQLCYAGSSTTNACTSPPGSSQAYGFDTADNLTRNNGSAQQFNAADELCWTVSGTSANACASPPGGATTYNYDDRGNRTSAVPSGAPAICDAYDQGNRLSSIKTGTGSSCTSPTVVGTYGYDGAGLRQSKTVSGTTTQFVWDPSAGLPLLLQEKAGSGTAVNYIYGPGGLPVEQIAGATTLFLHHDQLGSTRLVTDAAGATGTATTATYDPYGNVASTSGSLTTNLMFGGQYLDAESGLYYIRARYLDVSTGQWLTRDPAVGSTRSPYAYVAGNPLNTSDPSGLDPWSADSTGGLGADQAHSSAAVDGGCLAGGSGSLALHPLDTASRNPGPLASGPLDPGEWVKPFTDAWHGMTSFLSNQLNPHSWSVGVCVIVCYQYNISNGTHQWGIGPDLSVGITGNGTPTPNGGWCVGAKLIDACHPNQGPNSTAHGTVGGWNATWSAGIGCCAAYWGDEHPGAG
jgi:RHS repeat-associated protein